MSGRRAQVFSGSLLDDVDRGDHPLLAPGPSSQDPVRVLHVDDDAGFREVVKSFLEDADGNLSVVSEPTAEAGRSRLDEARFDCVVSDYEMPGMNGLELLRTICEDSIKVPFILYTGKGSEEIASEAIAAGVTDYMQKGVGVDQYQLLANRIENVVERHRAEQRYLRSINTYHHLVEQNLVGIYVIRDDEIVFVNRRIAELLDYEREEVIGRSLWDFIDERDHETVRENVERRQSGDVESIEYSLRIIHRDGTPIEARVHGGQVEIDGEPAVMGVLLEGDS